MRVLFITWEFPPLISGGLGTACYGMVQALLRAGVEVDLVLPTLDEAYFALREPEDADTLPLCLLNPDPIRLKELEEVEEAGQRLELLGLSPIPESYLTPGFNFEAVWRKVAWSRSYTLERERLLGTIQDNLIGSEDLFRKVQELTIRAANLAGKLDFDVIHAHDWLTYPAGLVLRELTAKPLVAHLHATEFDRADGIGDERIHKIEYTGLTQADRVIAVSQYTAQMAVDRYHVDINRVRIVHNAHSFQMNGDLPPKKRIFKGPVILFLGRITLQKGPDYFLDVAAKVLKRHPEARFVMAGAGDMMTHLLHRSAHLKLGPRFLFTDFLNRRQVEQVLRAADIFIMPSVSEPFGIVPLEAMAHGVAAVISSRSGVAEVLDNVFKVDFWDTDQMARIVCDLIEDPTRRQAMAEAGRAEVLAIKWDEAAEKIRSAYRELA
jgi:glycosyltransferase involved in cell wall biosynthesis